VEAQVFYFNKVFKSYFKDYTRDIDNIFILKNGKVDAATYVNAVSDKTIGFEGLHFYLFRIHNAFLLIDILWKIMLTHDKERTIFKYIFEIVINQLFEEYIFLKAVLKGLEEKFHYIEDEEWIVDFLYFYDHFTWKNKKFVEMYDKYNWFFKNNLIRYPNVYYMDETAAKLLNEKLMEHRQQVDKRKHHITNKMTYKQLNDVTTTYFKSIVLCEDDGDMDWLLFSRKSILNRLETEVIQKRLSSNKIMYVSEAEFKDIETEFDERETKNSITDKL